MNNSNNDLQAVLAPAAVAGFTQGNNGNYGNHGNYGHHGYDFNAIFHGSRMADGFRDVAADIRDSSKSRELINRIDSDNAKVALQSATAELLALKYRNCKGD